MNTEPLPVCPYCLRPIKFTPFDVHLRQCAYRRWRGAKVERTPAEIFDALLKRMAESGVQT